MLDFIGEKQAAQMIESAIKATTGERKALTPDLGGKARTTQVTNAIVEKLKVMKS